MELIREIEDFSKDYIEEKESTEKNIKFSTPFITANSKNKNNRRYPFEVLNTAIKKYSTKIESGKGYGADYHPHSGDVTIPDISHRITKIFMDENKVAHIEGEILPGEKGKKILQIVKSGGVLGVSARGFGEMKMAKDGVNEIQKGYSLSGIDFVVNPSEDVATIDKGNIFESAPVEIEEEKFFSLEKELAVAVKAKAGKKAWITDFSNDEVIYRIYSDGEIDSEGEDIFYKVKYKISNKEIELVGEPEKVERKTTYEMTEEDKLHNLYLTEYLTSGGKKTFGEYCKLMEKK